MHNLPIKRAIPQIDEGAVVDFDVLGPIFSLGLVFRETDRPYDRVREHNCGHHVVVCLRVGHIAEQPFVRLIVL